MGTQNPSMSEIALQQLRLRTNSEGMMEANSEEQHVKIATG